MAANSSVTKYKVLLDGKWVIVQKQGRCCWFDASGERIDDAELIEQIQEAIKNGDGKEVPIGSYISCCDEGGCTETLNNVIDVKAEMTTGGLVLKMSKFDKETCDYLLERETVGWATETTGGMMSAEDKAALDTLTGLGGGGTSIGQIIASLTDKMDEHDDRLSAQADAIANLLGVIVGMQTTIASLQTTVINQDNTIVDMRGKIDVLEATINNISVGGGSGAVEWVDDDPIENDTPVEWE
jgi:hypothetical protein